ncbi:MAG: RnfABCDGE type electron transport complex subunit D [Acetivibrionales bacterium]|nr:RnfABCDGE type electron transport complex subunit D [Clostridiaceae bacterium]
MENTLFVNSSPHIRSEVTTQRLMLDVIIALIPAAFAGIYFFGIRAALLIAVTVISSVGFEYIIRKVLKRNNTIGDFSAAVTGLILALNLPPTLPIWMAIVGSLFAIVIVKQLFGGLGYNFVNPALAARAFLVVSYGARMTTWIQPLTKATAVDAVSYATPMGVLKGGGELPQLIDMFLGNIGGSLGETSALALIIGGIYLLARGVISWHIPVVYVGTVGLFAWIIGPEGIFTGNPLFHILAGGLMLGAIFMATDYTTSPMTKKGIVIYAFGCGLLTMLFRLFTNMPEGVSYAILLMNVAVPMIDRYTKPARFGGKAHV